MNVTKSALILLVIAACAACISLSTGNDAIAPARREIRVRDCEGPPTSLSPELKSTLAPRSGHMAPDDQWADIAERVPGGFAGVLYSAGKPVLLLTRPEEAAAAKAALSPLLEGFPVKDASVWPVRWDFVQLVDWYNYFNRQPRLWNLNVNSADKSEADNRIVYRITDSASLFRVRALLDSLAIPCDLVLLRIAAPIQLR